MFDNVYFAILVYVSLTAFVLLLIVGLVLGIYGIVILRKISNRTDQALQQIHSSASNFSDLGANLASFVAQGILFSPKRSFFDKVRKAFFE